MIFYVTALTTSPINVTAESVTSTSIRVTWVKVEEQNVTIQGYKVFYAKNEYDSNVNVTSVLGNTSSALLDDLQPYTWYNITVLAYTSNEDGPNSTAITVRTLQGGEETL